MIRARQVPQCRLGAIAHTQLGDHVVHVQLDGMLRQAQLVGDDLVLLALGGGAQDLTFARRQVDGLRWIRAWAGR